MIFKDLSLAIASTAIVHFLNNVFKFLLMKRNVDWKIVLPFGLAAIPFAFLGAWILTSYEDFSILTYHVGANTLEVYMMNLVFGIVLIIFALIELIPKWSVAFSRKSLILGGGISGFFGGLSGHQGALRSAFLIKYKLEKEVFIATGIVIALIIDVVRTSVYFSEYEFSDLESGRHLIVISLGAALVGAITGKFFLKKIKINTLTITVSLAMIIFGISLASGLLSLNT